MVLSAVQSPNPALNCFGIAPGAICRESQFSAFRRNNSLPSKTHASRSFIVLVSSLPVKLKVVFTVYAAGRRFVCYLICIRYTNPVLYELNYASIKYFWVK